jgi:CRISPR-associated protein Cmr4
MADKTFDVADCVFLYLETGTRVGGGEETRDVDLPLQREPATGFPLVPSSSFKGSLRARARLQRADDDWVRLLGSSPESEAPQASSIVLSDALPLLFPVRALAGVFAWATSVDLWARFRRDLDLFGVKLADLPAPPALPAESAGVAPQTPLLTCKQTLVLEELTFPVQASPEVAALGEWLGKHAFPDEPAFDLWRQRAANSVVVLPPRAHRYFLENATQVTPRIKMDPTRGVAADGSLWTEEYLPPETLMYALVGVRLPAAIEGTPSVLPSGLKKPADALSWVRGLAPRFLHLGSDQTLGKGMVRLRWAGQKAARGGAKKTKKTS